MIIDFHSQEMTNAARSLTERPPGTCRICCQASSIREPAEHDFDPVAASIAALVVFHGGLALRAARDAGAYPFVFQRLSEPVSVIAAIPKQPADLWQTFQPCPCTDVVADLTGSDDEVQRPPNSVTDGMQLGIHTALGAPNPFAPPFFTRMLVAVLCALRYVAAMITVFSSPCLAARQTIICASVS